MNRGNGASGPGTYPRTLTPQERSLVEWVLPAGVRAYLAYREFLAEAVVIGQGRRGEGEIILGRSGALPDFGSPLAPVLSFGTVEIPGDEVTVTVREMADGQVSVEIVGRRTDAVPAIETVIRRWTYAEWRPGGTCPQCGSGVREVRIPAGGGGSGELPTLAVCPADRRLWIHDAVTGACRPIPLTNYYNELMLLREVRDPAVALDGSRFFADLPGYSDADLAGAFLRYNRLMTKIPGPGPSGPVPLRAGGRWRALFRKFFG